MARSETRLIAGVPYRTHHGWKADNAVPGYRLAPFLFEWWRSQVRPVRRYPEELETVIARLEPAVNDPHRWARVLDGLKLALNDQAPPRRRSRALLPGTLDPRAARSIARRDGGT